MRIIAAGGDDSAAITTNGSVWMWGDNGAGELGDGVSCTGTSQNCASNLPLKVVNLQHVIGVAVGFSHVIALRSDHSVWCWGDNSEDELGQSSPPYSIDHPVTPGTNQDETHQVSAGNGFSIALRASGA